MRDRNVKFLFASARHTNVVCPRHLHDTMEIVLVTSGTLHMEIGEVSCRIRAGQGAFIPPFTLHSFEQGIPNTCHVLMFSGELVTYFHQHCKTHIASTPLFTPSQESFTLAQVLLPDSVNDAAPLRAQAVLAPLCHEICTQCGFAPRALPPQDTFSRALDYIHTHFTEPLTAEQVARKVGLHPVTLSKGFRRSTGLPFNTYLNYLRCSHAAILLKSSGCTASEAAFTAGFGSIRSFNRAFIATYGVTPTEYRAAPII